MGAWLTQWVGREAQSHAVGGVRGSGPARHHRATTSTISAPATPTTTSTTSTNPTIPTITTTTTTTLPLRGSL